MYYISFKGWHRNQFNTTWPADHYFLAQNGGQKEVTRKEKDPLFADPTTDRVRGLTPTDPL